MCHGSTGRHFRITEGCFVAVAITSNEMPQGVAMVKRLGEFPYKHSFPQMTLKLGSIV